jgi:hypothetical protein
VATTTLTSAGGGGGAGARASLTKAYLELHDPKPGGAGLGPSRGRIAFQFNPSELTLRKAARWGTEPARDAQHTGPAEFQGAEPSTLDLEMFFDASVGRLDVTKTVDTLFACCVPTSESRSQRKPVPPLVVFHWGKITGFAAYITSVSASYTLLHPRGHPDPCNLPGQPAGDRRRTRAAEPHLGGAGAASDAHPGGRRDARRRRGEGLRHSCAVAWPRRGQRHRRPDADPARYVADRARTGRAVEEERCPEASTPPPGW